ncbi:MAG TPA: hypothetical protein VFH24_05010 [Gemmatimonadales bacterium]|nr:hypothetical protein [Gemmatimonadales bacterium]
MSPAFQPRHIVRLALVAVALSGSSASAFAQTVVEVQGGGSSLADGYGATANFWRSGMDGWVGIGYLDGFRAGAFLRKSTARGDTLGFGNSALVMRLPTDIFTPGYNLLVQGVSYAGGSERTSYLMFGGASSAGVGAPSFQPTSIEQPMGAFFFQHRVEPTVRLTGTAIIAERQTFLPGVQWQPTPDLTTGFVIGMGSDRPYAASSLTLRRGSLGVQASYAWNPERFRRVAVPTPNQTEVDRDNIMITYDLGPHFSIGVARQNFVQDSADAAPVTRATGNTVFAGGRWRGLRLTSGLYHSESGGSTNLSSYFALGRELTSWLDAELFLLQSRPEGQPTVTTPVANLRWRISPRIGVSQQFSLHQGRPTVLFGASLMTPIGDFAADYQIVHQPLQPSNPFRSTLNLTARLQLGAYSTSLGTYVRPDGAIDYSASGSTFLYMGTFGGAQPQQIGGGMARYVVRGSVRDDQGNPVEGAAIELNGGVVYTNSSGEFFLRARHPQQYPIKVLLGEFLLPGQWEVLSAPETATAAEERRAIPLTIILRRAEPPAH